MEGLVQVVATIEVECDYEVRIKIADFGNLYIDFENIDNKSLLHLVMEAACNLKNNNVRNGAIISKEQAEELQKIRILYSGRLLVQCFSVMRNCSDVYYARYTLNF